MEIVGRALVSIVLSAFLLRVESVGLISTEDHEELDHSYHSKTPFLADNSTDPLTHPRFMKYCRLSETPFSGSEGSPVQGYTLKKVFLLLSPGQRALHVNFENIKSPSYTCDFELFARSSDYKKIKDFPEVADIFKHMQPRKGGFKIYQPYPKKSVCDDEELSPLGISQLILLGDFFASKYPHFKFHEPSPTDHFTSAHSIQSEAVYQSVFAFMHGLLHEKNFVHTSVEKSLYNFCSVTSGLTCACHKAEYLQEQIAKGVRKGFYLFKNTAKFDSNINVRLKIPHHAEIAPREIISYLSLWICEAKMHPCQNGACLNISVPNIDEIFQSAEHYLQQIRSSGIFQSYARLITYPFHQRLFQWMRENKDKKMTIFGGEEEFLSMVMSVLGIATKQVLSPASRLAFEVHESLDRPNDLILKVYLDGMDVSDELSVGKDLNGLNLNLHRVIEFYQSVFADEFKNGDYEDECLS